MKFKYYLKRHRLFFWGLINVLVLLFLSLIISSVISLSVLKNDQLTNHQLTARFFPIIRGLRKLSDIIYLPYYLKPSRLPAYKLVVNPEDYDFLNSNLPPAYSDELLSDQYKQEIKGKLYYNGQEYKVRVRYRGQHSNHWSAPKKSWQIEIKGGKLLDGRSELNLILPYDRYYIIDELDNYRAKKLGLLTPASRFVKLKVNGYSQGVYFESEGWSNEMIERGNELSADTDLYGFDTSILVDEVGLEDLTHWEKHVAHPLNTRGYENLKQLIDTINHPSDEKFFSSIENVLDMDKFYAWHINHILMDSIHGEGPNLKLYFNKDTGKFEFISWDVGQAPQVTHIDQNFNILIGRLYQNPEFLRQRNQLLWQYVKNDDNLKDDLAYYDQMYELIRYDLYRDRLKIKSNLQFDREITQRRKHLEDTYKQIQEKIKSKEMFVNIFANNPHTDTLAKLEIQTENFPSFKFDNLEFSLQNNSAQAAQYRFALYNQDGVKLSDLKYYSDSGLFKTTDKFEETFTAQREIKAGDINIRPIKTSLQYFIKSNSKVNHLKIDKITLNISNYLSGKKADINYKFFNMQEFAYFDQINFSSQEFIKTHPIFKSAGDSQITIGPGTYNIDETIVVPKRLKLTINPGTNFFFAPSISLVSYSPVLAQGTQNKPITFGPKDENTPWGVFAVIGPQDSSSTFEYCQIKKGSQSHINGIYFTGQLAIHNTQASVKNSTFESAQGDDAFNIKYGQDSLVENNLFINNSADAIDFDWTHGEIKNNQFQNNGNDAIDISGSQVEVNTNIIRGSGDKGISVGEKSDPLIVNNLIVKNNIGIEIKDLSQPVIINNSIVDNKIGINEYQKKAIFGGGFGRIYNSIIWDNSEQITLDKFSKIELHSTVVEGGFKKHKTINEKPQFNDQYLPTNPELSQYLNQDILDQHSLTGFNNLGTNLKL